jgi:hypothetical protein
MSSAKKSKADSASAPAASAASAPSAAVASGKKKSKQPVKAAVHLKAQLQSSPPAELLTTLEASGCRPLDTESEQKLREVWEKEQKKQKKATKAGLTAPAEEKVLALDAEEQKEQPSALPAASPSSSKDAEPDPSSFTCPVIILDLSSSPAAEVTSISAFNLQWAPLKVSISQTGGADVVVKHAKEAAAVSSSTAATVHSHVPFSLSSDLLPGSPQDGSVVFYSVETALFSAPSSDSLGTYQQRLKQLPAALASNATAMSAAKASGELADIGALYLEKERLEEELARMKADVPPNADILEVRDTITLPFGLVPIDGRVYFLMYPSQKEKFMDTRRQAITDIHPCGRFHASPFADPNLAGGSLAAKSKILTPKHTTGLVKVCGGKRPQLMKLLYSGDRDGFMSADFHRQCDNKGPTFIIIRSSAPYNTVFGGEFSGFTPDEEATSLCLSEFLS